MALLITDINLNKIISRLKFNLARVFSFLPPDVQEK